MFDEKNKKVETKKKKNGIFFSSLSLNALYRFLSVFYRLVFGRRSTDLWNE